MNNSKVELVINDTTVWNPMVKAVEIFNAIKNNGSVTIDFVKESPNISTTELLDFFENLEILGVDLKKITVLTGNCLENYNKVNVQICNDFMYELEICQKIEPTISKNKNINYHFGCLISRTTMPRLDISSYLYSNYCKKTFQTFNWQANSDYHRTHLELEKLIAVYGIDSTEFENAVFLLKNSPIVKNNSIKKYPIIFPEKMQPLEWYNNFFVDIVCETWYQGQNFFLTEKFWRPIITKTPFIIHGPRYMLKNLKKLGFKTFNNYWDEGYDEDPGYHNIVEIKKVINYLSQKNIKELKNMYNDMSDILDHNLNIFKNLTYGDFNKIS